MKRNRLVWPARNQKVSLAFLLFMIGAGFYFSQLQMPTAWAEEDPSEDGPDLVISSLTANVSAMNSITYSYTITNVGNLPVNLDGPTEKDFDNVSVQAFISKDTLFQFKDDLAAGGTIIGRSPLGKLQPGESRKGTFRASLKGEVREYPYLILMVDWKRVVEESNESNNLGIVGIGTMVKEE